MYNKVALKKFICLCRQFFDKEMFENRTQVMYVRFFITLDLKAVVGKA